MDQLEIKTQNSNNNTRTKIVKAIIYLAVFILTALIIFTTQIIISGHSSTSWMDKIPILSQIKHLVESADNSLKGEERDRINILLLGMGGKNHEGAYLTDTVILASIQPSIKKTALISIPRDLTIPMEGMGWRKINNVNAYAEVKEPGSGGLAASQALGDVLNIPVDYYLRVDFEGFINIINELGGVKIYVENVLDDYSYPVLGKEEIYPYEARFEHLHIDSGWQEMDGELALKYARSRHGAGGEGSDFARARRQQKILEAVKDKVLSLNVLFKPRMIGNIIDNLKEHVSTNFKVWELVKLWGMAKEIKSENIITRVLDDGPNGLLTGLIAEDGAYILTPRSGDFAEIQYLVQNIFSEASQAEKVDLGEENPLVEVRNGTWINGLASRVALDLEKYGFRIARVGNSSRQNFQKSVIYDLTYGEKIKSLTALRNKTNANVSYGLPEWLTDDLAKELAEEKSVHQPDFILVLGQDADVMSSGAVNREE
ncbi:LCP family protein [Candidatus Falkowbacteria bacterium]|nr:LCP family protein [Candidatus Falkowbacteria bacterium]